MKLMSMRQFKSAVRHKDTLARDTVVRKLFLSEPVIEAEENAGDELIVFTITTDTIDREKDIVALDGWDIANFEKNPVVLWGHQSYEPPVGRSERLFIDGHGMKSAVKFVPERVPIFGQRAQGIKQMCQQGFLSATSVGFRPLEYKIAEDRDDGEGWFPPIDFIKQELMEFSIVSIPCNPEALIDPPDLQQEALLLEAARAQAASVTAALTALRRGRTQRQHQGRRIAVA